MRPRHYQWASLGLLVACLLISAGVSLLWSPSVKAVLPPRPTVTSPADDDSDDGPILVPAVEQIYLNVTPADQRYWSVVQ
jgi:hypothetical protein